MGFQIDDKAPLVRAVLLPPSVCQTALGLLCQRIRHRCQFKGACGAQPVCALPWHCRGAATTHDQRKCARSGSSRCDPSVFRSFWRWTPRAGCPTSPDAAARTQTTAPSFCRKPSARPTSSSLQGNSPVCSRLPQDVLVGMPPASQQRSIGRAPFLTPALACLAAATAPESKVSSLPVANLRVFIHPERSAARIVRAHNRAHIHAMRAGCPPLSRGTQRRSAGTVAPGGSGGGGGAQRICSCASTAPLRKPPVMSGSGAGACSGEGRLETSCSNVGVANAAAPRPPCFCSFFSAFAAFLASFAVSATGAPAHTTATSMMAPFVRSKSLQHRASAT
jgi:hypothetical protein